MSYRSKAMNEEKNPSIPARFRNIELPFTVESAEKLLEGLIFALEEKLDEVEHD